MVYAQKILLSTQTIATTSAGLLAPIYAIYVEKVGGGILETSASYALFAVVYGLLMLVMGKMTDKVKYQELFIVAGFFISGIGYVGYLFVSSVFHLFILQAILGIAQAVMTPAHDGLYTKHLDDSKTASEWATWEAVYAISTGVSAFVGGIIVYYISFEALFIAMFMMSFSAGLYLLLLPRGSI
jgi:sugar phosphate permease